MDDAKVPQPMRDILRRYLCVEGPEALASLRAVLRRPEQSARADAFRAQLRAAIEGSALDLGAYEALTGEDFDSPEALRAWLRTVWSEVFD